MFERSNITAPRGWKQLCLHTRSTRPYLPRSISEQLHFNGDMLRGIAQAARIKPVSQGAREGGRDHGKDYMQNREYHIADLEI